MDVLNVKNSGKSLRLNDRWPRSGYDRQGTIRGGL